MLTSSVSTVPIVPLAPVSNAPLLALSEAASFRKFAADLIQAAKRRWPRFGPWQISVTCNDDSRIEWKLQGRSWKIPDVGDKARIGSTFIELERRVLVVTDE